ncbi:caspase family protein [Actinoplanes aureus]|uniref:Caspase family protein n=1 Tax=Actinoplanes aureus TaxID=2792083 RepID=A0A931C8G0_9ACTN|nr:caspase family protein [Actinoplanes aureus]MBG0565374.1 caspase family protein [Actinoplanes aureus]
MSTSFILSIGVNLYRSAAIKDLRWAGADAIAFHDAAVRGREVGSVRSRLLVDQDASTANLRESLGGWLAEAGPEDNVVAFFAGHGARELLPDGDPHAAPEAYLLPSDVDLDRLYSTGFSLSSELPVVRKRIRARNVTLIFDCCHAGGGVGFADGTRSRGIDGPLIRRRLALTDIGFNVAVSLPGGGQHEIGDGFTILMACGPHQSALERDTLGHGIFTYHLLRLLAERRDGAPSGVPIGVGYTHLAQAVLGDTNGQQLPILEGRLADQQLFVGGSKGR